MQEHRGLKQIVVRLSFINFPYQPVLRLLTGGQRQTVGNTHQTPNTKHLTTTPHPNTSRKMNRTLRNKKHTDTARRLFSAGATRNLWSLSVAFCIALFTEGSSTTAGEPLLLSFTDQTQIISQSNLAPFLQPLNTQSTQRAGNGSDQQVLTLLQDQPDPLGTRSGFIISLMPSMNAQQINQLIDQIETLKDQDGTGRRVTVLLHFTSTNPLPGSSPSQPTNGSTDSSLFEDQLKLARYLASPKQRQLRFVSWIDRTISNHALLPILSTESLVCSAEARLLGFDKDPDDFSPVDETTRVTYLEIAKQRSLFPPDLVNAFCDPTATLSIIKKGDGDRLISSGNSLEQDRSSGTIIEETVITDRNQRLDLSAQQLRKLNVSSRTQDRESEIIEYLDLATLQRITKPKRVLQRNARLLEIKGPISSARLRRWQSNLAVTKRQPNTNTWLIEVDSDGGDVNESSRFANWLSDPGAPIDMVAGRITNKASGDAALIALTCKPLYLSSDAILGGPGLATPQTKNLNPEILDSIAAIASKTGRSEGLIEGIVDPSVQIYPYLNRKTGAIIYSSEESLPQRLAADAEDPNLEIAKWDRQEPVDLSQGITARRAVELGLAEGIADSNQTVVNKLNLETDPLPVTDQALIRAVEKLGSSNAFAILLLFIGFAALSAEFSSPGLGIPGFISLLCFSLYFWIKLLSGTAEWLELVALLVGITCIGIEFFVLPGFGIFGIGGFLLTGFSIILMSQTFVVPQNTYQLNALSNGVWVMLGGLAGVLAGVFIMRTFATRVPVLRALAMEKPDTETLETSERIIDYQHLLGQTGLTSTPLHPSGKARFGDETIQVVSDGVAIEQGQPVVVVQVRANHVVVNAVND